MPRNPERNLQLRDARRAQLLSSALELFVGKGLAATKITDIARAAGISQGLLYHYFPSKEAIYVELVGGSFRRLVAAARGLEKLPLPPEDRLAHALTHLLEGLAGDDDFARHFILNAQAGFFDGLPDEAARLVRRYRRVPYRVVASILAEGQRAGTVVPGDPHTLSTVFWSQIKGLALHRAAFGPTAALPEPAVLLRLFLTEP